MDKCNSIHTQHYVKPRLINSNAKLQLPSKRCKSHTPKVGMLKPVFWQTGFRLLKTGFRFLLTFIKIYYYISQIILCITHCNVRTRKAVSTLICSFSRFSLNEVMNIVHTLCFIEKLYLIKTW